MSNLVNGQTLVSFKYTDKNGIETNRVGRVEKNENSFLVVFVGGGKFRTFQKNKISDLTVVSE